MLLSSSMRSLTWKGRVRVCREERKVQSQTWDRSYHLSEVVVLVQEVLPCSHKLLKFLELLLNLHIQFGSEWLSAILPKMQGGV